VPLAILVDGATVVTDATLESLELPRRASEGFIDFLFGSAARLCLAALCLAVRVCLPASLGPPALFGPLALFCLPACLGPPALFGPPALLSLIGGILLKQLT
jgi:hypothetical protein